MAVTEELARRFQAYVDGFGDGRRIIAIHLFGIEHGQNLSYLSSNGCKTLASKAGFKESLGTELHKGIKLAPYAKRRD